MKYELIKDDFIINDSGVKLFRIKYLANNELGGYIQSEDNLSQEGSCRVLGDARVFGNARVFCDAQVFDDARVFGNTFVYGKAQVFDDARVFGDAWVYGNARLYGNARVFGNAQVFCDAQVCGDNWEISPLQIKGSRLYLNASRYGYIKIGCLELSVKDWKEKRVSIGEGEKYTPKEIEEYGLYIDLFEKWCELNNLKEKK